MTQTVKGSRLDGREQRRNIDAVSRAYYGAFRYARAMLLACGEEPRTHAGPERLLHRDVVRAGLLSADVAKLFSRLLKFRQDADSTAEFVFTAEGAAEAIAAAEAFVAAAKQMLATTVIAP